MVVKGLSKLSKIRSGEPTWKLPELVWKMFLLLQCGSVSVALVWGRSPTRAELKDKALFGQVEHSGSIWRTKLCPCFWRAISEEAAQVVGIESQGISQKLQPNASDFRWVFATERAADCRSSPIPYATCSHIFSADSVLLRCEVIRSRSSRQVGFFPFVGGRW